MAFKGPFCSLENEKSVGGVSDCTLQTFKINQGISGIELYISALKVLWEWDDKGSLWSVGGVGSVFSCC